MNIKKEYSFNIFGWEHKAELGYFNLQIQNHANELSGVTRRSRFGFTLLPANLRGVIT